MEVYYKDFISEGTALEKLVDDLMLVVQGAHEFAEAAGASLTKERREEVVTRLERLRETCRRLKEQVEAGAVAADKALRRFPYSAAGFAFGFGLAAGVLLGRRQRAKED